MTFTVTQIHNKHQRTEDEDNSSNDMIYWTIFTAGQGKWSKRGGGAKSNIIHDFKRGDFREQSDTSFDQNFPKQNV